MANKKHFLIYYVKESGEYRISTPCKWAMENKPHFPGKIRTHNTESRLKSRYGFDESPKNDKTVVLYNFNVDMPLMNGIKFL